MALAHYLKPLTLVIALGAALPAAAADLVEVYDLARASDPQLQAAESTKLGVGEGVVQARAALLPTISGTANLSDSDSEGTSITQIPQPDGSVQFGPASGEGDSRTRTYRIALQQSLYNHGNYTRLKGARALRSKSEADYAAALDGLYTRVASAYFTVLNNTSNLEAAEAEEKAVKRQLEQADQRFEVGLTAITDVHEARARFDASRAAAILARIQLEDSFEALAELTGKRLAAVDPLNDEIPLAAPNPSDAEAWVKVALNESPTLASRRFALESAEYDIKTAKSAHLPFLSGNVSYADSATWGTRSSNDFTFPDRSNGDDIGVGVTLTVPIFEGFATQSRVRQALYSRDVSADLLEQDRRAVERNIRNAFRQVIAGISEVEARQQALVSARSALEATEAGFEVGTRTIVDVLLSQQQLYAAQREHARARHTFIVAGLELKRASGVIELADLKAVNALLR